MGKWFESHPILRIAKERIKNQGILMFILGVGLVIVSLGETGITQIYPLTNYSFVSIDTARVVFWIFVAIGLVGLILVIVPLVAWLRPSKQGSDAPIRPKGDGTTTSTPNFSVHAKVYLNDAVLEVTNHSQLETFRGTFRIKDHELLEELHLLYWDEYGSEAKLGNGDTLKIQVAHLELANPRMMALYLIESSSGKPTSLMPHLYNVQDGVLLNAAPIYLEVVIKPISSSRIEHRAFYALEQASVMKLVFREIDSIPLASNKEDSQT